VNGSGGFRRALTAHLVRLHVADFQTGQPPSHLRNGSYRAPVYIRVILCKGPSLASGGGSASRISAGASVTLGEVRDRATTTVSASTTVHTRPNLLLSGARL
jgi:hypothetical protein